MSDHHPKSEYEITYPSAEKAETAMIAFIAEFRALVERYGLHQAFLVVSMATEQRDGDALKHVGMGLAGGCMECTAKNAAAAILGSPPEMRDAFQAAINESTDQMLAEMMARTGGRVH